MTFEINGNTYEIDTDDSFIVEIAKSLAEQDPKSFPDGFVFFADNIREVFEIED